MRTLPLCAALTVAQLFLFFTAFGIVSELSGQPSYFEGNYGTAGLAPYKFDDSSTSWSYSKPSDWPKLCLTGSRQSPISFNVDITEFVTNASLRRLQFSPGCVFPRDVTQARIVNEGEVNTVSFERQGRSPEDLSECTVRDPLNGRRVYHFTGLHFNVVPVHRLRMLRPDGEMHISFTTDDSKEKKRELLILAVMLVASATINNTSARTLRHILVDGSLPPRHAMTTCFLTEDLSISSLIPERQSYLLYNGSLTHPPCTENVRWVVMTSPIFIPRVAFGKLRDSVKETTANGFQRIGNARQPQALNGRHIFFFEDKSVAADITTRSTDEDAWSLNAEGVANRLHGALMDGVPAGSSLDVSHDNESSSSVLVAPLSSDSALLSVNGTLHSSSQPDTHTVNSSDKSSIHVAAEQGTTTLVTTSVPFASESDGEKFSGISPSNGDCSNATARSSSAPQAGASSSAFASIADPSVFTESSLSASSAPLPPNHSTTPSMEPLASATPTAPSSPSSTGRNKSVDGGASNAHDMGPRVADFIMSFVKSAWAFVRAASVNAFKTSVAYAKENPTRAGIILLCILVLIVLIRTCYHGWRRPVYVVGINPTELQPLNSANRFGRYGGTNTAAVRPTYGISA